jgi:hypothetical protein
MPKKRNVLRRVYTLPDTYSKESRPNHDGAENSGAPF